MSTAAQPMTSTSDSDSSSDSPRESKTLRDTTETKLILARDTMKAQKNEAKVTVEFVTTDLVNDDDVVLILSPKELQALISNYEIGSSNKLRSRLKYYKDTPNAKRRAELYFPRELRIHSHSNLTVFAKQ